MLLANLLALASASTVVLATPLAPRDVVRPSLASSSDDHYANLTARREYEGVGCSIFARGMDAYSTDLAVQGLKDQCRSFPETCNKKTAKYAVGDVVAFFCYWRGNQAVFNEQAFSNALGMITDQCGGYTAGSYSSGGESDRQYSYGYTLWKKDSYCNIAAGTPP